MAPTSIAELPADVRSALPERAQNQFLRVFVAALNSGEPEDVAKSIAFRGLANGGWYKSGDTYECAKRAPVTKRAGNDFELRVPVAKVDGTDDEAIVSGWAYVSLDDSGNAIVDHDNETIPVPVLERAAANFTAKSREFNAVTHYSETCGHLIESVVFTPAKRVAMGLDGSGLTGWWVSAKVRGAAAKRARSGDLKEFSIEATAIKRRTPAGPVVFDDLDVSRITLVDAGAGIGVRIEAVKAAPPQTVEQAISPLSDPAKQVVMSAIQAAAQAAQKEAPVAEPVPPVAAPKAGDPTDLPSALAMIADLQKQIAALKAEDSAESQDAAEVAAMKALPASVRKQLDEAKAEREAVAKRLADAEKALADRDLADQRREFVAKAKTLKFIPGSHELIGEGLRIIDGISAKDASTKAALAEVTKALESANVALSKSALFQTQGGVKPVEDGSASAQLDAKAREIIANDPELKKLPVAKAMKTAIARAYDENPALYEQVRASGN